jgi:hypothetical protein
MAHNAVYRVITDSGDAPGGLKIAYEYSRWMRAHGNYMHETRAAITVRTHNDVEATEQKDHLFTGLSGNWPIVGTLIGAFLEEDNEGGEVVIRLGSDAVR